MQTSNPAQILARRGRQGCLGCLLNLIFLLVLGLLLATAVTGIFAPWGFYLGGRFRLIPYWQGWGTLRARSGNYVLYVGFGPSSRGSRMFPAAHLTGIGYLCTPRGEKFRMKLGGDMRQNPDLTKDGEAIHLYMNNWTVWHSISGDYRPSLDLRGHWKNPNLIMDDHGSISNAFQADGTVYRGHDPNRPYSTEIVPVTLVQGSYSQFKAACAAAH